MTHNRQFLSVRPCFHLIGNVVVPIDNRGMFFPVMPIRRVVVFLVAMGILGSPCWSKNSKSKVHKHKNEGGLVEQRTVYFQPTDIQVITRYYTPRSLPP